jgi:signal transduction histidine kinase/CheY-like chemotaxis protein
MENTWHAAKAEQRHNARSDERGRDEFVVRVVHVLNNVLTPIVGYPEIVLSELLTGDPVRADLEELAQAADQASTLTCLLLSISREARMWNQAQPTWQADPVSMNLLFSRAVHDLETSLALVEDHVARLSGYFAVGHPARADLQQIERAVGQAALLVCVLRAIDHGVVSHPKVLSLNSVIVAMEQDIRCLTRGDIELVFALDPSLGQVKVDPTHVERVIINLVLNARDVMPDGGRLTIETANVELDADYSQKHPGTRPGCYVLLAVSDTGTGMTDETKSRIFEPFFTTKEEGKGTGLGLATVYGIVKQSDGYIWPYSELGKGTTFKVYLPRVSEQAASDRQEPSPVALPRGTETILLVEDEYAVCELVRHILERQGYTVLAAYLPSEAVRLSQQYDRPIPLLITDIMMPEMSGTELAERLVASRPEMKVLYISGYTDNAIARQSVLGPGVAYLEKPFAPTKLVHLVRKMLDESSESGCQPVVDAHKGG